MKKLILLILICAGFQIVVAQNVQKDAEVKRPRESDERGAILKELADFKKEQQNPINSLLSTADVGEPDSFGRNAKFLGTAVSGTVIVYRSCDPAILLSELDVTLGADDRCLAHTPGGAGSNATFTDIGRINLPGRAADNVIYFVVNNLVSTDFENNSANGLPVFFFYSPRLTIESAALNDPAALDPVTGQPLNGKLNVGLASSKFFSRTVPANDFETYFDNYSSAATRGFARSYFADLGLPQSVINQLYRQPMTIRLNLRVSVRGVSFGQYAYTMRFLGD